jgi:hypothetical protein
MPVLLGLGLAAALIVVAPAVGVAESSTTRDAREHERMTRPRALRPVMSVAEARAAFVGKTRVTFGPGHGTQVSYMRPDGAIFLWYPGNAVVLPGRWDIEARWMSGVPPTQEAFVCFRYGPNTYNPVTGAVGGRRECMPARVLGRLMVDRAEGDVFGLATRSAAPFRLPRERTTIAALKTQIGPPRREGAAAGTPPIPARRQ